MGAFKKFLKENEDVLQQIFDMLDELSDEEIDEFGYFLYSEFFDNVPPETSEDEEQEEEFDAEDVKEMIDALGPDMYEAILDLLLPEDIETDTSTIDAEEYHDVDPDEQEVQEGVSRKMKTKNINRKKRKFMTKTKADLRRTKAQRKKEARQNMASRKRYYRANKMKIKSYQKSRAAFIKKGKHKVKLRRSA